MSKSINRGRAHRRHLREEAAEREAVHSGRTPQQQMAVLNSRLGVMVGAVKERTRLISQIGEDGLALNEQPIPGTVLHTLIY